MIQEDRRFWKLLLFTIPTLGIYSIYFWFRFTQDLNEMNKEEKKIKNYIVVLLLSIITFGIYRWVWFFYLADRVQTTGELYGIRVKPGPSVTLIWKLFGSFVANFLVIHNMNKVAHEYNKHFKHNTKVKNLG